MDFFNNALNFLFPIKCGICGKIGLPICEQCEKVLKKYEINLVEDKYIDVLKNIQNKKQINNLNEYKKIREYKKSKKLKKTKISLAFYLGL